MSIQNRFHDTFVALFLVMLIPISTPASHSFGKLANGAAKRRSLLPALLSPRALLFSVCFAFHSSYKEQMNLLLSPLSFSCYLLQNPPSWSTLSPAQCWSLTAGHKVFPAPPTKMNHRRPELGTQALSNLI